MTERIYYKDPYATEFSARVLNMSEDGLRVTLDRSAFYPTSGGQQFDTGLLNKCRVVDVVDEDDAVVHVLSDKLDSDTVQGQVDWVRRFDHMQQHTGQHVLSAVFEDLFGFRTASVHFGDDYSSIDLETDSLSRKQILETEARANAIVAENHPVAITFENGSTVTGLRKPPPREGELRIITIENVDRSACGGTHVRATGEIGAIVLRKQDRMHGNVRIEFLCGNRALRQARDDYETLSRAAAAIGVAPNELSDRVVVIAAELRDSERGRKKLAEDLAKYRAVEAHQKVQPDSKGIRWIVERTDSGSLDDLRAFAHALGALERAAFIGVIQNPPQLLFAASQDSGIDAGQSLKTALTTAGGRGGGSPRVAQGSVAVDQIENVVAQLMSS